MKKTSTLNLLKLSELLLSFISIIIVFLTLVEMGNERIMAHKPDLFFQTTEEAICWYPSNNKKSKDFFENATNLEKEQNTLINEPSPIKLYNIGEGAAKDIIIDWNYSNNIERINKHISKYNYSFIISPPDEWGINDSIKLLHNNKVIEGFGDINYSDNIQFIYSQDKSTISLPSSYFSIIKWLAENNYIKNIPSLSVSISYNDIQGVEYSKTIFITTESKFHYTFDDEGSWVYWLKFEENECDSPSVVKETLKNNKIVFIVLFILTLFIFTIFIINENKSNRKKRKNNINNKTTKDKTIIIVKIKPSKGNS